MVFEFHLDLPSARIASNVWKESLDAQYRSGEDLPDVTSLPDDDFALIIQSCQWIERTDARFHVGGFGRGDWGLDTGYDMSFFLEDVPDAIHGLRRNEDFEIGIMSQGVDRQLEFLPEGEDVTIRCYVDFNLLPDIEVVKSRRLDEMLTRLAYDFTVALEMMDRRFLQFNLYKRWRDGNFT